MAVVYRRVSEAENLPISLDMGNVMPKRENILSQIQTSPPTPQCFSATGGTKKKTSAKETRSRLMVTYQSKSCISSLNECGSVLSIKRFSKNEKKAGLQS